MLMYLRLFLIAAGVVVSNAETLEGTGKKIQFTLQRHGSGADGVISFKTGGRWTPALSFTHSPTRVVLSGELGRTQNCTTVSLAQSKSGLVIKEDCGAGTLVRHIAASQSSDLFDVTVEFAGKAGAKLLSVEDRFAFVPPRRNVDTPHEGPLDLIWSQDIKSERTGLIPMWAFKSPVVMYQQAAVFAALLPNLDTSRAPYALDLDVTSDAQPWLSYGQVNSGPYGHSYFRRSTTGQLSTGIKYSYAIEASAQPAKLGYQRAVRLLWERIGKHELISSLDEQKNATKPELELFDDWRHEAWVRYAGEMFRGFDCDGAACGTLASMRNVWGEWDHPAPDAWFNSWFQTLRTAYGWYIYGKRAGDTEIQRKAESILNLALRSPRDHGAFSTIYLLDDHRWIPEDGWAGFPDDYHAFCMSWTAYWMLQWANDLTPNRRDKILAFTRPYGDFLLEHQLPTGAIPSWYTKDLKPRVEFRDFNAETAGSALFLQTLADATGHHRYSDAAIRAMDFVNREVLPRQRWSDFETYKSCARKNFDFYDRWTAQYPQNNLSTIQAAMAYLALYRSTKQPRFLEQGTRVLDYLLLTQQVWNNPAFSPKLVGGFTTQNTDAEWSDARQGYAAVLLWNYYRETGSLEYLERAVAAARSTFAVAPWENWAHTGYINEHGSLTGIHWGTGSAMTSVEIMTPMLGDAYIDLRHKNGVGFNACSLRNLKVDSNSVSFHFDVSPRLRSLVVKFDGVDQNATYRISANGHAPQTIAGAVLASKGFVLEQ